MTGRMRLFGVPGSISKGRTLCLFIVTRKIPQPPRLAQRKSKQPHRSLDLPQLPKALTDVLHYCDGRPTGEVLQAIATGRSIAIEKGVIRTLVDFNLLGAGEEE